MYKKIPGNEKYRINLNKEIIDENNNKVILNKNDTIIMYGMEHKVNLDFLALIAWYEIDTIPNVQEHLKKIKFANILNTMLRIKSGKQMYFTEPIYYNEKYRIIPNFSNYAIDIDGNVLNISTNTLETNIRNDGDYMSIYIYNPDKCVNKNIRIHRLKAMAWIDNDDYLTRPYVNHIDGIKINNNLSNLEWVSHDENVLHSRAMGLHFDMKPMKVRDIKTGNVHTFVSAKTLADFLGTSAIRASDYIHRLPGHLFAKRYEIKSLDDNTPWYYDGTDRGLFTNYKNVHIITVLNKKTGEKLVFNNARKMAKFYNLTGLKDKGIEYIAAYIKKNITYLELTYDVNITKGPYTVLNIKTNKAYIVNSIVEAAKIINMNRSKIQSDLKKGLKHIYSNKFIIHCGINVSDINIKEYIERPKLDKIKVINVKTKEFKIYDSIRALFRETNTGRKTIVNRIKSGKVYNGYLYRTL